MKEVLNDKDKPCEACNGLGYIPNGVMYIKCAECNGKG